MKHCLLIIFSLLCFTQHLLAQEQVEPQPQTPVKTRQKSKYEPQKTSAVSKALNDTTVTKKPDPLFNPFIAAGFNASQIWGDQITGYRKFGFNGGPGVFIRLPKHFSVSFELIYSMNGSKSGGNETMVDSVSPATGRITYSATKLIMDYIDVPVMFSYHDKKRAIFSAGVAYTNLVRFQNWRQELLPTPGPYVQYDYGKGYPYRTAGLDVVLNLTLIIAKHYGFDFRYNHSLTKLNSAPITYSTEANKAQQMDYLTMRFRYIFY